MPAASGAGGSAAEADDVLTDAASKTSTTPAEAVRIVSRRLVVRPRSSESGVTGEHDGSTTVARTRSDLWPA